MTEVKASKDGTSYTIGRYIYDKLGRVARFVDGQVSGKSCTYGYDLTDRLCEAVFDDGTAYRYTYDVNDCLVKEVQTTPDGVRTVTRAYDADSRETTVICGSAKIEKTFDKLGRLSSIRRNGGKHTTAYTYETASDGGQTGRIKTVKNGSGTWEYAYDAWGNVSKATENGSADSHTYTYDAQGQLTREYDPDKKLYLGYQYDAGGNLTEVRSYPAGAEGGPEGTGTVLKTFAYGSTWKDQLASVTMEGKTRNFTYDANGNLLSDGKYTYSWTKGSLLEKVTGDGLEAVYTYDASGIRTSKKVNGITTEYLTAGGSDLSEKKNGEWVDTSYGLPDEGWHEYFETGFFTSYSRKGDQEMKNEYIAWKANEDTGTVYYKFADNPEVSSTRVTLEDDDQTMNVFYGKNFDSATGQVVEGEFKDVLIKK